MVARMRAVIRLSVFLVASAGLFVGCDEDGPGGAAAYPFSVRVDGTGGAQNIWVVRHDLTGRTALDFRPVNTEGIADFGDIGTSRVSCSILRQSGGNLAIFSYLNVPGGAWHVNWNRPADTLGTVDLTVNYPAGEYTGHRLAVPGIMIREAAPPPSPWHFQMDLGLLDNHRFSAYAAVENEDADGFCGWLSQLAFRLEDVNSYTLNLDRPLVYRDLTTSRACLRLAVHAYRPNSSFGYNFADLSHPEGATNWRIPICAAPVDRYLVEADLPFPGGGASVCVVEPALPGTIMIPTLMIDAAYDAAHQAFTNVTVGGPVDYHFAYWYGQQEHRNVAWKVYTQGGVSTIPLPALGDSVRAATGLAVDALEPKFIGAVDYDTMQNLDGLIYQSYRQETPPPFPYFGRSYEVVRYFPAGAAAQAPSPSPVSRTRLFGQPFPHD